MGFLLSRTLEASSEVPETLIKTVPHEECRGQTAEVVYLGPIVNSPTQESC